MQYSEPVLLVDKKGNIKSLHETQPYICMYSHAATLQLFGRSLYDGGRLGISSQTALTCIMIFL